MHIPLLVPSLLEKGHVKAKEALMLRFEKRVQKLLEGSIDVHIHSAPDIFPRIMNDVDLALSAKQEGMRAILIKSHVVITADRAEIASQ